ncbi:MAG: GNAT family N-acetyltransferase [Candidatus Zixiibacteriota bacterium]|nr:MAG: GNAT family N-acetyltransferase [candidate division Zixibacteria bacterium]
MSKEPSPPALTARELTTTDWPHIKKLFGDKGACGGCWCMHWRIPRGGKMWETAKGAPNRKAFHRLVKTGKACGILAFDGDEPVGWCSFGLRSDFPRTETIKAYRRADIDGVWSINCFYLAKEHRARGLGSLMAEAAVKAIRKRGGGMIEAYPVTLTKDGKKLPAAFSFTGPEIVFQRLGFKEIQRLSPSRPLYRLKL